MGTAKLGIQDFLPSLSFSLSESDSTAMLAADSRTRSISFSLSQQIFDGGRKKLAYEAGRLSALYSQQESEAEYRSFLSTVMSLYHQYLLLRETADIRKDLLDQAARQLAILKREMELGLALETDYLEYTASFMEIEQDCDQGLRDLGAMERQFKAALNLNEGVELRINAGLPEESEYLYYEPWLDYLWALLRDASVALRKLRLELEYSRKEHDYARRWYLPSIGAQGSISFSGNSYPLTEPVYALQFTFDFSGLDFLSLNASRGAGFERSRLRQLSGGLQANLRPLPAYPLTRNLAELNLLESALRLPEGERELRESLYELVISHDNKLRAAGNTEKRIDVMEKRLLFSRLQLEKGEMKRIDYLAELSSLAQARISLADYRTQVSALERNLEIQTNFPFGGLADACRNH
jgi:outer membrane protein TolC